VLFRKFITTKFLTKAGLQHSIIKSEHNDSMALHIYVIMYKFMS